VRQAVRGRQPPPDAIILTGGLHEAAAQRLLAAAREHAVSTLGLVEPTDDAKRVGRELGLTAWLVKPVDPLEIAGTVRRLIERRKLQQRTGILGESPPIQEVLVKIEQMAPVTSTVLIEGESGTGKELVARAIHDLSPRRGKPFVAVNSAGLPETLLESELFGHEKGAFTGAAERRLGRFELANSGTILLDEVGGMPPATQVQRCCACSRTELLPWADASVGRRPRHRGTNQSLKEAVSLGRFRDDLFTGSTCCRSICRRCAMPAISMSHLHRRVRAARPQLQGHHARGAADPARGDWPGKHAAAQESDRVDGRARARRKFARATSVRRARAQHAAVGCGAESSREIAGQELEFTSGHWSS
jgi:hypothetical protein